MWPTVVMSVMLLLYEIKIIIVQFCQIIIIIKLTGVSSNITLTPMMDYRRCQKASGLKAPGPGRL